MIASTLPRTTLGGRLAPEAGSGRFRVDRPGTRADSLLASALRLPRSGADVSVTLRVRSSGTEDRWERTFDRRRLTSRQHLDDGLIFERVGPVELRLAAQTAEDGSCQVVSVGAALVVGRRVWPLPDRWCPRIHCEVVPAGVDRRRLSVAISAPCGRILCCYGGLLVDLPWDEPATGAAR